MNNLFMNVEPRRITVDGTSFSLSAGTSDVNSGIVDTRGYQGIAFMVLLGAIATSGSVSIKLQHGDSPTLSDAQDIAGSAIGPTSDTDDNKVIITEVYRPVKRYLRVVTTRGDGGNSSIDGLVAFLYLPHSAPVTFGSTVYGAEFFNSPSSGTA